MAFDGRHLVVYDRHELASFDAEGEFRWPAQVGRFSLSAAGVRFVGPLEEEEMIFGVDSLDAGSRRVQLWRVQRPNPNHRELLCEPHLSARARAVTRGVSGIGRVYLGKREARSYWARHQDCVVVSDGGRAGGCGTADDWGRLARDAGVPDLRQFEECLDAPGTEQELRGTSQSQRKIGVRATPTFVSYGGVHSGVATFQELVQLTKH